MTMNMNTGRKSTSSSRDKPRLTDIAKQAGVSIATVSKVINGRPDVSDSTREYVESLLETVGYSKPLKAQKTNNNIEIVFQKFDSIWGMELLQGACGAAREHNCSVTIAESGNRRSPSTAWVNGVLERRPLGVILVFSDLSSKERKLLSSRQIPYVTLDPYGNPSISTASVRADNWTGGLTATRFLIKQGHRRIGIINGPREMMCSKARYDGYCAALEESGITVDSSLVRYGDFTVDSGRRKALSLLSNGSRPSAVFAGSDLQAMGLYETARRLHLRIPDDISVIGFDDIQASAFLGPALTTIRQPMAEMASQAASMLFMMHAGKKVSHEVVFPTRLVVRSSTVEHS